MKLNKDGTVYGDPIKVGGGGILRCSNDDWIARFARKLRNTTSIVVELWALKDGLPWPSNWELRTFVLKWMLSLLFILFQDLQ